MQLSESKSNLKEQKFKLLKDSLVSLLFFFASCILFSFIFSIIFYNFENSTKMIDLASLLSLFSSGFTSCFIASKITGENYYFKPLVLSLLAFILFFAIAIFSKTKIFSINFLIKLLFPAFCFLGAFLGRKHIKTKRKKHYKRK